MKYSITRNALGCDQHIELTTDQYERVTAACRHLSRFP